MKGYFPKAGQDFDACGNLVLTFPERQRFYANRPGASWGDASEGIITLASELGLARIGGGLGNKVAAAVGSAVGAGTGLAAASVAQDAMAQRKGSTQPVDLDRAAMLGALGVGGEFLGYVGGRLLDPVEAGAAKTLARKYNEFFEEQLDQALIRGEPRAVPIRTYRAPAAHSARVPDRVR